MGKDKKKILFVDHDFTISGSNVSMCYLIKEFINNDYIVYVLTKGDETDRKYLTSCGAMIIQYSSSPFKSITLSLHISDKTKLFSKEWLKNLFKDMLYFFNGIVLSIKITKSIKPDIIYLNEYVTIPFGFYPKLKSTKVLMHIRSLFIDQKFNLRIYLLKKAIKFIPDHCFAITELEAKQVCNDFENKTNIKVIPEFLDQEDFKNPNNISELKNKFMIPDSTKIVTFLGGISYIKGSIIFIKSIEHLSISFRNVKFIIAGKIFNDPNIQTVHTYYKLCDEYLNKPNIKEYVEVLGDVRNINELIAVSDIVVSCSITTHFSRPMIEAWAQKKAVIATDILHSKILINNGTDGLIVKKNEPAELAESIKMLLENEQLTKTLGENGYLKVKRMFSAGVNSKKIVDYCNKIS